MGRRGQRWGEGNSDGEEGTVMRSKGNGTAQPNG